MKTCALLLAMLLFVGVLQVSAQTQPSRQPETAVTAVSGNTSQQDQNFPVTAGYNLDKVGRVLLVFLVLSLLFEVALTPIFNWRYFLAYFEGKGYKTPFTVILALTVFWKYDLDIIKDLLIALGYPAVMSFWGQVITALLIAGGSDGIFRIFAKLGIRNPNETKDKADKIRQMMQQEKENNQANAGAG
jgi:hypothetical protein